tara:strand:+ start:244 stop:1239 length:996 start_codon:yes stop_codon:yes gene_type:complete
MALALVELEFKILDKLLFYNQTTIDDHDSHEHDIYYTIDCIVNALYSLDDPELIRDYYIKLAMVPILKRSINTKYGEGQRLVSYWALIKLHSIMPSTIESLLDYLPYIGYWGDLKALYKLVYSLEGYTRKNQLLSRIVDIWVFHLQNEELKLNNNQGNFSLLCKWIPKQGCALHRDTKVVNAIVKQLYPLSYKNNRFQALKKYRKLVSTINKHLGTTEVLMCAKEFHKIDFEYVPKKCMGKYRRAWLDTNRGCSTRNHQSLLDRTLTRNNYLDHIHRECKNRRVGPNITIKIQNKYTERHILSKLEDSCFNEFRRSIISTGEVDHLAYHNL